MRNSFHADLACARAHYLGEQLALWENVQYKYESKALLALCTLETAAHVCDTRPFVASAVRPSAQPPLMYL